MSKRSGPYASFIHEAIGVGRGHLATLPDSPRLVERGGTVYPMKPRASSPKPAEFDPEPAPDLPPEAEPPPAVPPSGRLADIGLAGVEACPHALEHVFTALAHASERLARKHRHGGYQGIVGLPVHPAALSRLLRDLPNEEPQLGPNILAHRIPHLSYVAL
jgi:hypothetical protein